MYEILFYLYHYPYALLLVTRHDKFNLHNTVFEKRQTSSQPVSPKLSNSQLLSCILTPAQSSSSVVELAAEHLDMKVELLRVR